MTAFDELGSLSRFTKSRTIGTFFIANAFTLACVSLSTGRIDLLMNYILLLETKDAIYR